MSSNETELNDKSSDKLKVEKSELTEVPSLLLGIFKLAETSLNNISVTPSDKVGHLTLFWADGSTRNPRSYHAKFLAFWYNRNFPCLEGTYPLCHKEPARSKQNAPQLLTWVPELVLYGIRDLDQWELSLIGARPMRVGQAGERREEREERGEWQMGWWWLVVSIPGNIGWPGQFFLNFHDDLHRPPGGHFRSYFSHLELGPL